MDPAGAPWCDPRRAYGYGYGVGSAAQAPSVMRQPQQQPRQDAAAVATGGALKRSLGEVERWQQALYLRAVRQRVAAQAQAQAQAAHQPPIDIGTVLARSTSRGSGLSPPLSAARRATAREMVLLQELEKQLLGDDDEATGSACDSTVTSTAWGDTMQELNSITAASLPSLPMASATNNNYNTVPVSRSPTNSVTSSTASSTASSSPPTSTASSWQLLSEAAAAVADGKHVTAATHLAVLKIATNPRGDAEQRLVAMMAAALSSRIGPPSSQ